MPTHKQLTDSRGLTPKQQAFIVEYLKDKNGAQAAIRAGYSRRTAKQIGAENLTKPDVRAAIEFMLTQVAADAEITVERVMKEYARLAFLDPRRLFNPDGSPKAITELDDDTAAAISGIEHDTVREFDDRGKPYPVNVRKIRLVDKKGALDSVARHLGMFAKDAGQVAPQVILNINLGHQQIQTGVKRANPQGESQ